MPRDDKGKEYYFKKGALRICDERGETYIKGWPDPKARIRLWHNKWKPHSPEFRLVSRPRKRNRQNRDERQLALPIAIDARPQEVNTPNKDAAFLSFRASLPDELVRDIEIFRSHQWGLIVMAHHEGPAVFDLLESNPVLAYALANNSKFQTLLTTPEYRHRASKLLGRKQRSIAKSLGFPDRKATAVLLRKILPESVNPQALDTLREALTERPATAQAFSHIERVNAGVLGVATNSALDPMCTPALLRDIAASSRERYFPFAMYTLEEVAYMCRVGRPKRTPPQFSSLRKLHAFHEELSNDFEKVGGHKLRYCRMPKPPIPGTDTITPVTTLAQLKKEGKEQSHCVAAYSKRIAAGKTYIYRVLEPERATLAIVRDAGGAWHRGELRLCGNGTVSSTTERIVDEWLERNSLSA